MSRQATFPITEGRRVPRKVSVGWETFEVAPEPEIGFGYAQAGIDFPPAAGVVTLDPCALGAAITITLRDDDPTKRRSRVGIVLHARNGATLGQSVAHVVIPGWVGLLDGIGIVDGTSQPFVPGLMGVSV